MPRPGTPPAAAEDEAGRSRGRVGGAERQAPGVPASPDLARRDQDAFERMDAPTCDLEAIRLASSPSWPARSTLAQVRDVLSDITRSRLVYLLLSAATQPFFHDSFIRAYGAI